MPRRPANARAAQMRAAEQPRDEATKQFIPHLVSSDDSDDEDVAERPPWELGDEDLIAYNEDLERDGSEAVDLTGAGAAFAFSNS